jgi:hypothetical protein
MKKKEIFQLTDKMKVGATLILGDKTLKCVGNQESTYGTRYVFDNGISWTISNIISNIDMCQAKGQEWAIK